MEEGDRSQSRRERAPPDPRRAMEEGDRSQSSRERAPQTRGSAIHRTLSDYDFDYESCESRRKRRREAPIQFVSAGTWSGRSIEEVEREWELTMAARRPPPSAVGVWPAPGSLECESVGYRMMVEMGYEIGMGLGENAEGMLAPLRYNLRPSLVGLGSIEEPVPFYFETNLPNE